MTSTPSGFDRPFGVDAVTLDLFSSEGAPSPAEPAAALVACPLPRVGATQYYRLPLWRRFDRAP
jgi:hypothetical protein